MIAILLHPVTIVLATICIQWVVLAEVGRFSAHVPYVALAVVAVYAVLSRRRLAASVLYVRQNAAWVAPLAVYLVMIAAILHGSPGENIAPRQMFYLIAGIGLAASIATARRVGTMFRVGSALGLLLFVLFVELLARGIGLSWTDAITQFVRSGNLQFVIYSFFRPIFNSLDPTGGADFSSSTKNGIAICVLVLGLLFRSGSTKPQRDLTGMIFISAALALLVLLNTRSVIITAGVSLLLATILGAVIRPVTNSLLILLKLLGLLALVVVAVGLSMPDSAVSGTLTDRFSFEDHSAAARIEQYQAAFERIEKHPLTGSGYYEVDGLRVHNLFLGAWMHAGLAAFLLVVAFYVAVLIRWVTFLVTLTTRPERWVLPLAPEWIAPLPILPLFRVWLSGDAGHFALGEWIAISVFFGCCLANDLLRRKVARLGNGQGWSIARMPAGAYMPAGALRLGPSTPAQHSGR